MPNTVLPRLLEKCPTGIIGFDELSEGGLPRGRSTLVAGSAGSGKTLFAMEFILHGIELHQEPGVFVSFEENPQDLAANVASIGYDLARHQAEKNLRMLQIVLDTGSTEAGEFDLDGIFIRLGLAIEAIGARRIALDAVENLFAAFTDARTLRKEFRRLICWLKDRGITAVVTTERGQGSITRNGLEEYIADCVITLDNRVEDQLATRRLRIVKYRGSAHSGDECPFVLNRSGFSLIPISSAGMAYQVSNERVSSGIPSLDEMLGGGTYRGSSVLVSGPGGTGKSSIAAHMVDAACRRGEKCLYVALEESPDQIERNMASIGLDLAQWRRAGLLRFHAARPTSGGLENHLAAISGHVREFGPRMVIIDPITALHVTATEEQVGLMLIRSLDLFKAQGITSLFTAMSHGKEVSDATFMDIPSLTDTSIMLRNLELSGERTRAIYVLKARGIAHSNQIREFQLTDDGVKLVDILLDSEGHILTGSARELRKIQKETEVDARDTSRAHRRTALENRRHVLDAKIAAIREEFEEELHKLEGELEGEAALVRSSEISFGDLALRRSRLVQDNQIAGSRP